MAYYYAAIFISGFAAAFSCLLGEFKDAGILLVLMLAVAAHMRIERLK